MSPMLGEDPGVSVARPHLYRWMFIAPCVQLAPLASVWEEARRYRLNQGANGRGHRTAHWWYPSLRGVCDMRVPQVKEAPAQALRAMFAGIGQLLGVSDKIRNKSAPAPASAGAKTATPEKAAPDTVTSDTVTSDTVASETA